MGGMLSRQDHVDAVWGSNKILSIEFGNNFNTINVTTFSSMFAGSPVKALDLSTFDTRNILGIYHMFMSCNELTTIYVSNNFILNNVNSEGVFSGDTLLVGGNGTRYDNTKTTSEYARIDTPSTPGYFT